MSEMLCAHPYAEPAQNEMSEMRKLCIATKAQSPEDLAMQASQ